MYELKYLPFAKNDLKDIINYLTSFYPGTPNRFKESLRIRITNLKEHPLMYPVYDALPIYRYIVVGDYNVYYTVNDITKTIEVHRIIRSIRDIRKILRD